MRAWLARLLNRHDPSVDLLSLVVALYVVVAFGAVIEFLLLAYLDVAVGHHDFHAADFGSGIGLALGGTGLAALMHCWKWPGGGPPTAGDPS
ncbi:hypothetical protein GALL_207860 [mine drainage metagenome]|uniref:Uncharacterized protein n=1 Tax=mine drainage metagenome TaxID=410659 RepID=A0A1J5RLZ6_9ZZZZ